MKQRREFTVDEVFARIQQAPVRWTDLAASRDEQLRRRLRAVLAPLLADGAVQFVRIGGQRHLAVAGWEPTKDQQLQEIYDRCRAVDGCMVWVGHVDKHRGPVMYAPLAGTERSVRRRIWGLLRRKLAYAATVAMQCDNPEACVLFEHMTLAGRNDAQRGQPKTLTHKKAIAEAKRKTAKLDESKVAHILASEKSGRSLAKELNVSQVTVQKVRTADLWRNYRATPFSGLEAANDSGRARA